MRIFQFTEQAYPPAWNNEFLRVTTPNRVCDPHIAADLYHRYYDEWQVADELGLEIMVNEHHSTATCLSPSANLTLGILARITRRARLLALGVPLANRPDPLRIAEELSEIDVISRGRLEMGFVKGVPYELPVSNANPVRLMDRFWEAHDFILKAMTSHDGPFSWEGEHFTYRNVNIWPRPWQQPHPPVWVTATNPKSVTMVAERGYVCATFMTGPAAARATYDLYREVRRRNGHPRPAPDRFAYLALVAVARNRDEALRRGDEIAGYLRTTGKVAPQFANPPGYVSVEDNVRALRPTGPRRGFVTRSGKPINLFDAPVEDLMDAGALFAGTPDEVYEQIARFSDDVGGLGNLLAMCQGGTLSHGDTVDNLSLLATEVLPRLRESHPAHVVAAAE